MNLLKLFTRVREANEIIEASGEHNALCIEFNYEMTLNQFRSYHEFKQWLVEMYADWFYKAVLALDYRLGVEDYEINCISPLADKCTYKISICIKKVEKGMLQCIMF